MILFVIIGLIVVCFGMVVLFGAPYVPTLKRQQEAALDLLDLKPGQTLLELGCGDGRVLKAAAKRGIKVIGYELNPLLATIAWWRTRHNNKVQVIWGNFWSGRLPSADGVFVFLLDRYMLKLDKKIVQESQKPIKLVSFAFKVPTRKISSHRKGLYLYLYK